MTVGHTSSDDLAGLTELMDLGEDFARLPDSAEREARRRRRRRVMIVIGIIFALVLAASGAYVGWALSAPLPTPVMTVQDPPVPASGPAAVALPAEGSAAIVVAGADPYFAAAGDAAVLASGTNDPRPIASITKLITALVILEAYPLADANDPGPTIVFGKADHDLYDEYYVLGATIAPMPTGSSMSLRDALATMLVPSASNYADAVSTWAFGSQSGFLRATRDWLAARGLSGTEIVEPTGISARNVSTPSDLLAIGQIAAAQPTIAAIAATPQLSLPGPGVMVTTNALLGSEGITGLKTGNLGPGSYNMLYSATLDVGAAEPLTVVGVVLGGGSRQAVNESILASLGSIRAGFHDVPLAEAGDRVGSLLTAWGAEADVVVSERASIFTWSDTPITVETQTDALTTYDDGQKVGSVTWSAGPNTADAGLEIEGEIPLPDAWWRLTHPAELLGQ